MQPKNSGFFTLCVGNPAYCDFATVLAMSLDRAGRRPWLLTDDAMWTHFCNLGRDRFFEGHTILPYVDSDLGLLKLKLWQYLPYDCNVFIDADSFVGTAFDPERCLSAFAGTSYTASYAQNSWNYIRAGLPGPYPQWFQQGLWMRLFNQNRHEFAFPAPFALATSVAYYERGAADAFHDKALWWYEWIKKNAAHLNFGWMRNWVPDELCITLAYGSVEMPNVGDLGYNHTIRNVDHINAFVTDEGGIRTFSSGMWGVPDLVKKFYEKNAAILCNAHGMVPITFRGKT